MDFCRAIRNRQVLTFEYHGKLRVVEPHMLGFFENGSESLHAWQRSGGSKVEWRNFHTGDIRGCEPTGEIFKRPHSGYNPDGANYAFIICELDPVA